jgi:hypothetical protein
LNSHEELRNCLSILDLQYLLYLRINFWGYLPKRQLYLPYIFAFILVDVTITGFPLSEVMFLLKAMKSDALERLFITISSYPEDLTFGLNEQTLKNQGQLNSVKFLVYNVFPNALAVVRRLWNLTPNALALSLNIHDYADIEADGAEQSSKATQFPMYNQLYLVKENLQQLDGFGQLTQLKAIKGSFDQSCEVESLRGALEELLHAGGMQLHIFEEVLVKGIKRKVNFGGLSEDQLHSEDGVYSYLRDS